MKKPTLEQVAWVVEKIIENGCRGGTYRKLIYDIMGYGTEAYVALHPHLLELNNFIYEHQKDFLRQFRGKDDTEK